MRKSKFILSLQLMLTVFVLHLGTAYAGNDVATNIANGEKIFTEGKGDASACQGCHGEKALGNDSMGAPRLANIGIYYVNKQLNDFAADRRIPSGLGAVMNGFAKALTEQDRHDVAVYVNSLDYQIENSDLKGLADAGGDPIGNPEPGKEIVTHGVKGKVPPCQDCHGFNGRAARFPMLNQQRYVYLVNQLHNWRDDSRANDPEVDKVGIMRGIAKKLSDDDIRNIAAFLSTAPRVSPDGDPK
ncbi:MAG: c-type cytochrome [Gallionellaceae bacterium]